MSAPTYQRLESDLPSDTDGLLLHTFTSNHSRRYETPSPAPTESATGPDVDEEVSTVSHIKDVRQTAFPAESTGMSC